MQIYIFPPAGFSLMFGFVEYIHVYRLTFFKVVGALKYS